MLQYKNLNISKDGNVVTNAKGHTYVAKRRTLGWYVRIQHRFYTIASLKLAAVHGDDKMRGMYPHYIDGDLDNSMLNNLTLRKRIDTRDLDIGEQIKLIRNGDEYVLECLIDPDDVAVTYAAAAKLLGLQNARSVELHVTAINSTGSEVSQSDWDTSLPTNEAQQHDVFTRVAVTMDGKSINLLTFRGLMQVGYRTMSAQGIGFRKYNENTLYTIHKHGYIINGTVVTNADMVHKLQLEAEQVATQHDTVYGSIHVRLTKLYGINNPEVLTRYKLMHDYMVYKATGQLPAKLLLNRCMADNPTLGIINGSDPHSEVARNYVINYLSAAELTVIKIQLSRVHLDLADGHTFDIVLLRNAIIPSPKFVRGYVKNISKWDAACGKHVSDQYSIYKQK